jgi:hypothetical protein
MDDRRDDPVFPTRGGNAAMADCIAAMPAQPLREGGYALRVLEVPGRRSGRILQVPLAVVLLGGNRYLVSPTRDRAWARNLLAAGTGNVVAGGERERVRAVAVDDVGEAVAVLRVYVQGLTFAARQFPFAADDPAERVRAAVPSTAVFRLLPAV